MPEDTSSLHERFKSWITHRYFVRIHMTLMLSAVLLSGVVASGLLHAIGVRWLIVRYPIAVAFSYGCFFLLVRLWLAYAVRVRSSKQTGWSSNGSNLVPDGTFDFGGGWPKGSPGLPPGGGGFGGGGASGTFEGPDGGARMAAAVPAPKSGGGGSGGFDLGLDDDGLVILLVFIAVVLGIFGASVFLIVHAPVILSEAAFQAAMAAGLVKMSRDMHAEGWVESVFKATLVPFLVAFVGAVAFGWIALRHCPHGSTLAEVFRTCVFH
jgi:lysylphosphatidylglycerol synthetase-like protein (DUF2156 family)